MKDATVATEASPSVLFPADGPWLEEAGLVRLQAVRCGVCGQVAFPPRQRCAECGGRDLEPLTLDSQATLYSWTEITVAPTGITAPYFVGYVDFEEGVRVFGQLEAAREDLELGQRVEVVLRPIRQTPEGDESVISYKFRPAGAE